MKFIRADIPDLIICEPKILYDDRGFFTESFVCESKITSESLSKEYLLEQLKNNNISCKDVDFKVFGLSLATINFIFSLILSFLFTIFFINYKKN